MGEKILSHIPVYLHVPEGHQQQKINNLLRADKTK